MIVVSDTSPLSSLILVGLPQLLPQIFETIIVPDAVHDELMANGEAHLITQTIQSAEWIVVRSVQEPLDVKRLREKSSIDSGEAEAIILANELKAERLLIDERLGRIVAKQQGLRAIGVLGLLLIAKEQSLIYELKPWMDKLINQAKFRIHPSLYQEVLLLAGENAENGQR